MDNEAFRAVISLYERNAAAFAKLRTTYLSEKPWLDRFLHHVRPNGHILDLGCGNGTPIAGYLLSRGFRVTGIDSSPSMIARCKETFPEHTWQVADMRELQLGHRFDGILAWDSFFHLTRADQRQMFAIFSAHASKCAALMFNAGPADGEAIGEFQGEPLYHSSLSPLEYMSLLQQYDFHIVLHVVEDQQCNGRTLWLAAKD